MRQKFISKNIIFFLLMLLASCVRYDEGIDTYDVAVQLSCQQAIGGGIEVQLRDSRSTVFTATTDSTATAHFILPAGIYQVSASQVTDDGYSRTICNGNLNDLVVGGTMTAAMPVSVSSISLRNPILIKEVYCGGCQKDDGSGIFGMDKCIILYNNSSAAVSLDSIAIGMVDPYNAEAGTHGFLIGGVLDYAAEDWIPAINGIWYFQDGNVIEPYSELVVNVNGAIDNTPTYSNSINYANADYYCMYDPSYTSSDGVGYSNTKYYPVPASVIPTSHYLRTVKYGKGNAWPMSMMSPALLLFKPQDVTPREYAENTDNIIYPTGKSGNIVYACLKVLRSWVLDAVEVYNQEKLSDCKKRLTPDLDNGYICLTHGYGHALVRKVEKTVGGHNVYQDTNNSSKDFEEKDFCSLK